jgi:hypothetical protein
MLRFLVVTDSLTTVSIELDDSGGFKRNTHPKSTGTDKQLDRSAWFCVLRFDGWYGQTSSAEYGNCRTDRLTTALLQVKDANLQ